MLVDIYVVQVHFNREPCLPGCKAGNSKAAFPACPAPLNLFPAIKIIPTN